MEEQKKKEMEESNENQDNKKLKKDLEQCLKLQEEYLNGWKRAKADLINYKNEETKRIGEFVDYIKVDLILKILPILDNLERAEQHITENDKNNKLINGFLQIRKQIEDFLKKEKIEEIKVLGEKFTPETTEAIEEIESKDKKPGTVAEIVNKGYKYKDKVIRPVKAKIVKYNNQK